MNVVIMCVWGGCPHTFGHTFQCDCLTCEEKQHFDFNRISRRFPGPLGSQGPLGRPGPQGSLGPPGPQDPPGFSGTSGSSGTSRFSGSSRLHDNKDESVMETSARLCDALDELHPRHARPSCLIRSCHTVLVNGTGLFPGTSPRAQAC